MSSNKSYKNKLLIAALSLVIISILAAGSVSAWGENSNDRKGSYGAYRNFPKNLNFGKMGHLKKGQAWGRRLQLMEAVESNNYSLLGENCPISKEEFGKIVEIYNLVKNGKIEEAKSKLAEYQLPPRLIDQIQKLIKKNEIQQALDKSDYAAWLSAVGADSDIAQVINQDNFVKFVQAHNYRNQAKQIMEELGVKKPRF